MEKKRSRKNVNFRYKNIFIKKGVLEMERNYITSKEKVIERVKLAETYYNLEKILNIEGLIGKIIGMDVEKLSCPRPPTSKNSKATYPLNNLIRKNL